MIMRITINVMAFIYFFFYLYYYYRNVENVTERAHVKGDFDN